jgi:hypothetical protein
MATAGTTLDELCKLDGSKPAAYESGICAQMSVYSRFFEFFKRQIGNFHILLLKF